MASTNRSPDEGKRNGLNAPPPSQTGQAALLHPAFRSVVSRWTGSGTRHETLEGITPAAQWSPTRSPFPGRSTGRFQTQTSARFSGAFGRLALRHYPNPFGSSLCPTPPPLSYVPWLHDRYPLPRSDGRSDPDRLFRRHQPWFPDSRHQNFRPFHLQPSTVLHQPRPTPSALAALFCSGFVVGSRTRQNRRPYRVHLDCPSRQPVLRTGHSLPVALHPGVSPRCSYVQLLALQCRPGRGLSPCCSSALSGARAPSIAPPFGCAGSSLRSNAPRSVTVLRKGYFPAPSSSPIRRR